MATGYIVWDSKAKVFVAGPFLTSAAATSFANRVQGKTEGTKKTAASLTVESVTLT